MRCVIEIVNTWHLLECFTVFLFQPCECHRAFGKCIYVVPSQMSDLQISNLFDLASCLWRNHIWLCAHGNILTAPLIGQHMTYIWRSAVSVNVITFYFYCLPLFWCLNIVLCFSAFNPEKWGQFSEKQRNNPVEWRNRIKPFWYVQLNKLESSKIMYSNAMQFILTFYYSN